MDIKFWKAKLNLAISSGRTSAFLAPCTSNALLRLWQRATSSLCGRCENAVRKLLGDQPTHDPRVAVDLHIDERLDAREAGNPGDPLQARVPEPPGDELGARVNLPGLGDADRRAVSIFRADAVGLDQHRAAAHRPPTQHAQRPSEFSTLCRMPKQHTKSQRSSSRSSANASLRRYSTPEPSNR
jgi:hypothetical protein